MHRKTYLGQRETLPSLRPALGVAVSEASGREEGSRGATGRAPQNAFGSPALLSMCVAPGRGPRPTGLKLGIDRGGRTGLCHIISLLLPVSDFQGNFTHTEVLDGVAQSAPLDAGSVLLRKTLRFGRLAQGRVHCGGCPNGYTGNLRSCPGLTGQLRSFLARNPGIFLHDGAPTCLETQCCASDRVGGSLAKEGRLHQRSPTHDNNL